MPINSIPGGLISKRERMLSYTKPKKSLIRPVDIRPVDIRAVEIKRL